MNECEDIMFLLSKPWYMIYNCDWTKPVIKGTRIPVDLIIEKLSFGETSEQILESYPDLTKEHIFACLSFATAILRHEEINTIAS